MTITHVMLIQYNTGSGPEAVKKAAEELLALGTECIHPETNKAYILSCSGGKDVSKINLQREMTHAYVFEFANQSDLDYYMTDPAHMAFQERNKPHISGAIVVDYVNGEC